MNREARPLLLPTDAAYRSLSEVPSSVLRPLNIYNAIKEHDRGITSVEEVHDLLDNLAGQQTFGIYEREEDEDGEFILQGVTSYRPILNREIALIEGIAIRPSARRLQFGSFALGHLIHLAEQTPQIKCLWLRSVEDAIPFYEHHGFAVVDGDENKARPGMSRSVS